MYFKGYNAIIVIEGSLERKHIFIDCILKILIRLNEGTQTTLISNLSSSNKEEK